VTLGITCHTMLRGLRRLRRCVIIDDKLQAGIDREFRRVFAGCRDRLPDDAGLADYEDDWRRRSWTQEARCLNSPPDPWVQPIVPPGLRPAPIAAVSRSPRTMAGESKP
jgi:hypothetical protein